MLFQSYVFALLFLPVCLAGYWLFVRRGMGVSAKVWLLVMSFVFYGYYSIWNALLLAGSMLVNYMLLKPAVRGKKWAVIWGTLFHLGLLCFFKYGGFFGKWLPGGDGGAIKLLLPLGISFYTFSQISILVDTWKGEVERISFLDYCLYISYFPKLIQGPVCTCGELLPQFRSIGTKGPDPENCYRGLVLFVLGLGKKVLLADTFGAAVDFGYADLSQLYSGEMILLTFFYTLQLYFDFSGYCDMAMGISGMLGIELPVNFASPYQASNIIEFWKGWHITLSRFFTKYLYIPLGGNRKGEAVTYRNLLLVFFVSGLWHGTGTQFMIWGMLHGVLYVITRWAGSGKKIRAGTEGGFWDRVFHGFKVLCTFLYVNFTWIFFRAGSVGEAVTVIKTGAELEFRRFNRNMAGIFNLDEFWYGIKILRLDKWPYAHYILMVLFLLISLLIVFKGKSAVTISKSIRSGYGSAFVIAALFVWCVVTFSNVGTFLYVNF